MQDITHKNLTELIKARQDRQNRNISEIVNTRHYLAFRVFTPNGQYTEELHSVKATPEHKRIDDLTYRLKASYQDITPHNIITASLFSMGGTLVGRNKAVKEYLKNVSY